MADKVSATEKLRVMLDERGAIHLDIGDMTFWHDINSIQWCATEQSDGSLHVQSIDFMTPEQAIAATVGVDTNTGEAVRKLLDKLNTELCNAGCVVDCETREERLRLINAVKDKYAKAIIATMY